MAHPNPPGVSSTPSGRGFLFFLQILRGARHLSRRKREVGASPGGARRAGSEGERGRGKAHKPGSKSGSQAASTAGLDKTAIGGGAGHDPRGGRSRYILTGPPPPGVGRDVRKGGRSRSVSRPTPSRGGAGQSISRPAPPDIATGPPPRSDNFI